MNSSTERQIPVGRIGRPHGVKGEVTVLVSGDEPAHLRPGRTLRTDRDVRLSVIAVRPYRDQGLIVGFEGIDDREAAEALRGSTLMSSEPRVLESGEWWPEDLVGLEAVDSEGRKLGRVTAVVTAGAQDRLEITTPQGLAVEVPFVNQLVDDPHNGTIVVRPPQGLFPDDGSVC